jgi:hypothetical protein
MLVANALRWFCRDAAHMYLRYQHFWKRILVVSLNAKTTILYISNKVFFHKFIGIFSIFISYCFEELHAWGPDEHNYLKKMKIKKMYYDFNKSKRCNVQIIIYMFCAIYDWFCSIYFHISTAWAIFLLVLTYLS